MGDKRYPNMAADKLGEGVEVNYSGGKRSPSS